MKAGRRKVLRVLRRISREESRERGTDMVLKVFIDDMNILKAYRRGHLLKPKEL
jgi:hypothetical protein